MFNEDHLRAHWSAVDAMSEAEFRDGLDPLLAAAPAAIAAFERACAHDTFGRPALAVGLYREALDIGLDGERRRRAAIQLASSLRNLGRLDESLALITDEAARTTDSLDDAVTTVRALTLCNLGRDTEAAALAIEALAKHLPRYQRSMTAYARALLAPSPASD